MQPQIIPISPPRNSKVAGSARGRQPPQLVLLPSHACEDTALRAAAGMELLHQGEEPLPGSGNYTGQ